MGMSAMNNLGPGKIGSDHDNSLKRQQIFAKRGSIEALEAYFSAKKVPLRRPDRQGNGPCHEHIGIILQERSGT